MKNTFVLSEIQVKVLIEYLRNPKNDNFESYPKLRNVTMATLMVDAGLRVGEMTEMFISDIRDACGPAHMLILRKETTKSQVSRGIPLTPRLHNCLMIYLTALNTRYGITAALAFPSPMDETKPITTRQVRRIIGFAGREALKMNIHPHQLRHTFATNVLRTSNTRIVQTLLGHKNLSSTEIYTHPDTNDCRDAIEKLNPQTGICRPH